jgi:hypothetical protein
MPAAPQNLGRFFQVVGFRVPASQFKAASIIVSANGAELYGSKLGKTSVFHRKYKLSAETRVVMGIRLSRR